MELKVEIISIDFINPSSPNPNQPKLHKSSLLDQRTLAENIPLVLYYPAPLMQDRSLISQQLKKSLSTTLNHFYPFAGRISASDAWIDCNTDVAKGVPYKEANVVADLGEVIAKRDPDMVWPLLPVETLFEDAATIPLQIQASFFQCGGMTIGICASHLAIDGPTLSEFLRSWADVSLERFHLLTAVPPPDMVVIRSLLPPSSLVKLKPQDPHIIFDANMVTCKPFLFSGKSIAALKLHASRGARYESTRVQAVSALVWKCMLNALSTNSSNYKGQNSSSILTMYVNLRTRLDPPLPQNSFGNFVVPITVQKHYDGKNIHLGDLMELQKCGLEKFHDNHVKRLHANKEALSSVIFDLFKDKMNTSSKRDVDQILGTSWCGFKFYEIDFGWGKPTWASTNYVAYINSFMLLDTKEGNGIEAWVTLNKQDMVTFEQDNELLMFASFSPFPNLSNN